MKGLTIPVLLALAVLLVSLFAPALCPYDPNEQDLTAALCAPSAAHPMGTDRYGRDMLSRVIIGARVSVFSSLALVLSVSAFGSVVGALCGYCGGAIDSLLMRFSDVCIAFPPLVFALFAAALLGGGLFAAATALAAVCWPKYARLARSLSASLKERDFILAAKLCGLSTPQVLTRHVLPNAIGPVAVTAALDIGTTMAELAGLSFLGLGAQPPAAEWGSMMSAGRSAFAKCPWLVLSPGIAVFTTVSIFNMLGDALRDRFDTLTDTASGKYREKRKGIFS